MINAGSMFSFMAIRKDAVDRVYRDRGGREAFEEEFGFAEDKLRYQDDQLGWALLEDRDLYVFSCGRGYAPPADDEDGAEGAADATPTERLLAMGFQAEDFHDCDGRSWMFEYGLILHKYDYASDLDAATVSALGRYLQENTRPGSSSDEMDHLFSFAHHAASGRGDLPSQKKFLASLPQDGSWTEEPLRLSPYADKVAGYECDHDYGLRHYGDESRRRYRKKSDSLLTPLQCVELMQGGEEIVFRGNAYRLEAGVVLRFNNGKWQESRSLADFEKFLEQHKEHLYEPAR